MPLFINIKEKISSWEEKERQNAKVRNETLKSQLENEISSTVNQINTLFSFKPKVRQNSSDQIDSKNSILIYDKFNDEYNKLDKAQRPIEKKYLNSAAMYENSICPYCSSVFEKLSNRIRKCKFCDRQVFITKNLISGKYMILTGEQFTEINMERDNIEYSELLFELEYRIKNREYGLYRNAKYNLVSILFRKQHRNDCSPYELLKNVFELCYLDISGPNNVKNISPNVQPAFNSKNGKLYPSVLSFLEDAINVTNYTFDDYERIFFGEITKFRLPEMKLQPDTAWLRIKKHIKLVLSDSVHEE